MSWCQFKKHLKRPVKHHFCWPDDRTKFYNQPKNHIPPTRSNSLKQINYKVNLKTLDQQSNYKPHFFLRLLNYLTSFGHPKKEPDFIETNTADDATVRTVRAVLNDELSVCSCQMNSSSHNPPSYNSNSNEYGRRNKGPYKDYCKNHFKMKLNNEKNRRYISSSVSGSHSENTTSTMSSATSNTNSAASKSSISTMAATAVYSVFCVCCVRGKKAKRRRRRKKAKLTRKCCIKYNRPNCMNSSYYDSVQQSNESNEVNAHTLNSQIGQFQLELTHQPNCIKKDKFYSANKYTVKHTRQATDFKLVGKTNDLFLTRANGLDIGFCNFNGKIKMSSTTASNNCHVSADDVKKQSDDKCCLRANSINNKLRNQNLINKYNEHSFANKMFLINSEKHDMKYELFKDRQEKGGNLNGLTGYSFDSKRQLNNDEKENNCLIELIDEDNQEAKNYGECEINKITENNSSNVNNDLKVNESQIEINDHHALNEIDIDRIDD